MLKRAYDVFGLVVNFLEEDWMPKHITISLFEAFETLRAKLVKKFARPFRAIWLN